MGKAAKIPCVYCNARLAEGVPFCSSCEQPTTWATNEQRTAYELRQWRMKRATPGPERMSARVEAMMGTAVREESRPLPEAPTPQREVSLPRPGIVPHPNGVWGNGRNSVARAPQPWPPRAHENESNGHESNGNRSFLHLAPLEPDPLEETPVAEELIADESAPQVFEDAGTFLQDEQALDEPIPDAISEADEPEPYSFEQPVDPDGDPEWAVATMSEPASDPEILPKHVSQPVLEPAVEPQVARDDEDGQAGLVRQLLLRVDELETKVALMSRPRRSRVVQKLIDLFVTHDPA